MRLHKSAKARDVLMSQNQALSQAERRVLILCDGQRIRSTIENMLGDAASTTIDVLIEQGYLQTSSPTSLEPQAEKKTGLSGLSIIGKRILRDSASSDAPPTVTPPPTPTSKSLNRSADVQRESRRSIVACKMYMLDMLQLQRSMESSALAVDIQTATNEIELTDGLIQALRHLCITTKASMGERIAQRLLETMPESHIPMLRAEADSLFEKAPTQSVGAQNVVAMRRDVA